MLDYQINESISRAYAESVYGNNGKRKRPELSRKRFVCESNKEITPELIEKRNRRRIKKLNEPNYAAEAGKGFVRASNVMARDLSHIVPQAISLFGGTETAKKMKKGIDDWFNPIIYNDYGSDYGDEISKTSESGGKVAANALPAAGFAKVLKLASAAKAAQEAKNLYTTLNTPGTPWDGWWWKIPASVAASRAIESGTEKGAENLQKSGYENEAEVVREYGGFAPWILSPKGSMIRYGTTPAVNYAQNRYGNEDTKPYVDAFKKYALGTYEEPQGVNNDNDDNGDGGDDEDDGFLNCPNCKFSCNDRDIMNYHLKTAHGLEFK